MKILLNLLPSEKKAEMRRNVRFRMVVAHGSALLFLGFLYCGALLGISFLLSLQLASIRGGVGKDSDQSPAAEIVSYEKIFRETNAKTAEITMLLSRHVSWGAFFRELDSVTPPGVSYSKLLTQENFSFSLAGVARDREALLSLEKRVNDSSCFRDAVVPLSDKLVKENIDFQLDAVIEKTCIISSGG